MKSEVYLTLKMQVFWGMTLCHWVSSLWCFEGLQCLHLQGQGDCFLTLKMKALPSFGTPGSAHPVIQCHTPEDLNFQQHLCETLRSLFI
jgi:hypothetical protein